MIYTDGERPERICVWSAIVIVMGGRGKIVGVGVGIGEGADPARVDVMVTPLLTIITPEGERERVPTPGINVAGPLSVSVWPLNTVAKVDNRFVGVDSSWERGRVNVISLSTNNIPEGD
jgi:hypothetical protein